MYYLLIFLVILLIVALKGPVCEECGERDASALIVTGKLK